MVGTTFGKHTSTKTVILYIKIAPVQFVFAGVVEDSGVPLERFDVQNTYYDDMGHFLNVVSSAKMSMVCHV